MNTHGNVRAQATKQKIDRALIYLIKHKKFNEIFVKDICTIACINRSSFYEHYQDINDLMIKTEANLSKQMEKLFESTPISSSESFVKMFEFIKANREFYTAYLTNNESCFMGQADFLNFHNKLKKSASAKMEYSENELMYHMAFFGGGLQAICKIWISSGMKESPEEMVNIITKEYSKKSKFF